MNRRKIFILVGAVGIIALMGAQSPEAIRQVDIFKINGQPIPTNVNGQQIYPGELPVQLSHPLPAGSNKIGAVVVEGSVNISMPNPLAGTITANPIDLGGPKVLTICINEGWPTILVSPTGNGPWFSPVTVWGAALEPGKFISKCVGVAPARYIKLSANPGPGTGGYPLYFAAY